VRKSNKKIALSRFKTVSNDLFTGLTPCDYNATCRNKVFEKLFIIVLLGISIS